MPRIARPVPGEHALADVRALLRACELPDTDLTTAHLQDFLLARDATQALIGCVGLERHGDAGLLRSLAVAPSTRGQGLGQALVQHLQDHAAAAGITHLYLLTTTAGGFFGARGYTRCAREDVPTTVQHSAQFAALCPASAECWHRPLGNAVRKPSSTSSVPRTP